MPRNRPSHSEQMPVVEMIIGGVPLDIQSYFQQMEIEEVTSGAASGTVSLFDPEWDVLEAFLHRAGENAQVKLRFGFEGAVPDEWITLLLIRYQPTFQTNQGVFLELELMDGSVIANVHARSQGYTLSRYPRISDIAREIARRNSWVAVVETTKPHPRPYTQDGMSDTQFLAELSKDAVNEQGQGGYHYYVKRNAELHFHVLTYRAPTISTTSHAYNVGRDIDGEVLSFSPEDLQVVAAALGGRDTNFEIEDFRTRRWNIIEKRSGQSEQPLIGGGRVDPIPWWGRPVDRPQINRWVTRPFENAEEQEAYASYRKAIFQQTQVKAQLEILGDPYMEPMSMIEVNVIMDNGLPHQRWSGMYKVVTVTHSLTLGQYTTTCDLTRESLGEGKLNVQGRPLRIQMPRQLREALSRGDLLARVGT